MDTSSGQDGRCGPEIKARNEKRCLDGGRQAINGDKCRTSRHREATQRHVFARGRASVGLDRAGLVLAHVTIGHSGHRRSFRRHLFHLHHGAGRSRKRHVLPGKAKNDPEQQKMTEQGFHIDAEMLLSGLKVNSEQSARRLQLHSIEVATMKVGHRAEMTLGTEKSRGFARHRVNQTRSTGNPAACHSGNPSSKRRMWNPRLRSKLTASKENTQYGPRQ